jgi:hypothetical protein
LAETGSEGQQQQQQQNYTLKRKRSSTPQELQDSQQPVHTTPGNAIITAATDILVPPSTPLAPPTLHPATASRSTVCLQKTAGISGMAGHGDDGEPLDIRPTGTLQGNPSQTSHPSKTMWIDQQDDSLAGRGPAAVLSSVLHPAGKPTTENLYPDAGGFQAAPGFPLPAAEMHPGQSAALQVEAPAADSVGHALVPRNGIPAPLSSPTARGAVGPGRVTLLSGRHIASAEPALQDGLQEPPAAVAASVAAPLPVVPAVSGSVPAPVVPLVGGVLPPPGDECQLPGDLVEGYDIKSTRILTSSEPPAA